MDKVYHGDRSQSKVNIPSQSLLGFEVVWGATRSVLPVLGPQCGGGTWSGGCGDRTTGCG